MSKPLIWEANRGHFSARRFALSWMVLGTATGWLRHPRMLIISTRTPGDSVSPAVFPRLLRPARSRCTPCNVAPSLPRQPGIEHRTLGTHRFFLPFPTSPPEPSMFRRRRSLTREPLWGQVSPAIFCLSIVYYGVARCAIGRTY